MSPRQRALASPVAALPRGKPTNVLWLVGAEREFPFELPDLQELTPWYLYSLGAMAAAGLLAGTMSGMSRVCRARPSRIPAAVVFWGGLLVFGIVATPLANRFLSHFVFTWPLSLIVVHQIALAGVSRSRQPGQRKASEWAAVAGVGLLILACLLYFKLTRQLSLAPAWYFLILLPASWPLALPAARRLRRRASLAGDILWFFAVFSVYFWASAGVMLLRTARM
jgi:hypothetical protein